MSESYYDVEISSTLDDLIPTYLDNRRRDIQTIRAAVDRADLQMIVLIAHKIKGSGATYGFSRLSDLARAIEVAARGVEEDVVGRTHEALTRAGALRPSPAGAPSEHPATVSGA